MTLRSRNLLLLLATLVLLLPALYFIAYAALLDHSAVDMLHVSISEGPYRPGLVGTVPADRYRVGGSVAERFFQPANAIDRHIRRDHWQGDFAGKLD